MSRTIHISLILIILVNNSIQIIPQECELVIVGGSTGALAAAVASARNKIVTCLLQPTDWPGGQLTAGGVSAIDYGWQTLVNKETGEKFVVSDWDARVENLPMDFYNIVMQETKDSGKCWVSRVCYLPQNMLEKGIYPLLAELNDFLLVMYNTVPKKVEMSSDGSTIQKLWAIQRTAQPGIPCDGYDQLISDDVDDWYDPNQSQRFYKYSMEFGYSKLFIDGSEWGQLLTLSEAPYLQGIAQNFDGDTEFGDHPENYTEQQQQCGQSFTYGIAQQYGNTKQAESEGSKSPYPVQHPNFYSFEGYTGEQIWTYRRLFANGSQSYNPGDISLQNWGKGNDYQYGYIFKNKTETKAELSDWKGGVNQTVLQSAQYQAIGWNYAFQNMANQTGKISFASDVWGTCNNLTKYPYIRDTKRSVGMDGFVIQAKDVTGPFPPLTGTIYEDRVAIGYYSVDIHPLFNCSYPGYMTQQHTPLPYFIPYRALTNKQVKNLLVAGKTIAQSFLANSATRLHPTEWSSGTAAGVAAALMVNYSLTDTGLVLQYISVLQNEVKKLTPINWYLNNTYYPSQKESVATE